MSELQEEESFQCPYCASVNTTLVDLTAGDEQSFTVDCEVCCRPIALTIGIDEDEAINVNAQRESN